MKLSKNSKGFTLIEIVIVIVIIAILAAILVPSLLKWVDKAQDTKILSAAKTVKDCITAEISALYKSGESLGTDETSYDDEFWASVSEDANTEVTNDSSKDGYVQFTLDGNVITEYSYRVGDKEAYLNDSGAFQVRPVN